MNRSAALSTGATRGHIYIAAAELIDGRIPRQYHLKSWDPTNKRFVERIQGASRDTLYKIGYTQRDPNVRLAELNDDDRHMSGSIYVPYSFTLTWSVAVDNCETIEAEVHRMLSADRIAGEIFYVKKDRAIETINAAIGKHQG